MRFSIVIPVMNASKTLEELVMRCRKVMDIYADPYEIIAIDDGSTDNSWSICQQLATTHIDVFRAYKLKQNYGQHLSTICGMAHSNGVHIITIDDDLQFHPEDIPLLIDRAIDRGADIVYGIPTGSANKAKQLKSSLFKSASRLIEGKRGNGSSFRIVTQDLAKKLVDDANPHVFIDEIIDWHTAFIDQVNVRHQASSRKSQYTGTKLISFLFKLSFAYGTWPLRLMTFGGVVLSSFSFFIGLKFLAKKLIYNASVPGYTSLMVTILFSTGLMLLCFSALGYFIKTIIDQNQRRPSYIISRRTKG